MPLENSQVTIGIKDLINMTAGEIARQVTDDLRKNEIAPLHARLELLEAKLDNKTAWQNGAFETLWKMGVITIGVLEAWHYLKDVFK